MQIKFARKLLNEQIADGDHWHAKNLIRKKRKQERQNKRKARKCLRRRK